MTEAWSDTNRFNQSGYSAPTNFPEPKNYDDLDLFMYDMGLAILREKVHREWLLEEKEEARIDAMIQDAETKALREEYRYDI